MPWYPLEVTPSRLLGVVGPLAIFATASCLALTPLEGLVGPTTDGGVEAKADAMSDGGSDVAADAPFPTGSFVQKAQWANSSPYKCTLPAPVKAGNLVVALTISSPPEQGEVSISDTLNQAWKPSIRSTCITENLGMRFYYTDNAIGGNETVTMKVGTGTLYGLALLEYTGFGVLDVDGMSCAGGVSSKMTTAPITTTGPGLLIAIFNTLNPTSLTVPGPGWVVRDNNQGYYTWEDQIVGAAGPYQGTSTQKDNTSWTTLIAAFHAK